MHGIQHRCSLAIRMSNAFKSVQLTANHHSVLQVRLFPGLFNGNGSTEAGTHEGGSAGLEGVGSKAQLVTPLSREMMTQLHELGGNGTLFTEDLDLVADKLALLQTDPNPVADSTRDGQMDLGAISGGRKHEATEKKAAPVTLEEAQAEHAPYGDVLHFEGDNITLDLANLEPSARTNASLPRDYYSTECDDTFDELFQELNDDIRDLSEIRFPGGVPAAGSDAAVCIAYGRHEEEISDKTHRRHGSLSHAKAYYDRALALEPENADAYEHLGNIVWKMTGDGDGAAALLERAVSLDPQSLSPLVSLQKVAQEIVGAEEEEEEMAATTTGAEEAAFVSLQSLRTPTRRRRVGDRNVTAEQRTRFREVLQWVNNRLNDTMAGVEARENVFLNETGDFDAKGEGLYGALMRRALEKTLIDVSQAVPMAPQSLQELVRSGGSRPRDDSELWNMLRGENGVTSVDTLEKTERGRVQIDSIFSWASPQLKEALLDRRRAKHAQARAQHCARGVRVDGCSETAFDVTMDRDKERAEALMGLGAFENVWEGAQGEGEGVWDENRERARLANPLQEDIEALLSQAAAGNKTARAEVEDIDAMMRRMSETHNATRAAQQVIKSFAINAGFADVLNSEGTEALASGLASAAKAHEMRELGEQVDASQWTDAAVPLADGLEALRVLSGNLSLRGVDHAIAMVGRQGEAVLEGNRAINDDTDDDSFGPGEGGGLLDGLQDGDDPATLFRGGPEFRGLTLKDHFIEVGLKVRVVGLKTNQHLNGCFGVVVGYNADNERVVVDLDCSAKDASSVQRNATCDGGVEGLVTLQLLPEKLQVLGHSVGSNSEGFEALANRKFDWLERPGTGPDTYGGPGYWECLLTARTCIELKEWGHKVTVLGEGNVTDIAMHLAERAHDRFIGLLRSGLSTLLTDHIIMANPSHEIRH